MSTTVAKAVALPPRKVSRLKAVEPKAAEPNKPKILVFGKPGVGKTWVSLDFPKVYYIDTEGGADLAHYTDKLEKAGGAYFGPDQGSLDFNEVINQLQALATETHPFKTVVIDSFTKLLNLEVAHEAERLGDKNAFGADKKPAIAKAAALSALWREIGTSDVGGLLSLSAAMDRTFEKIDAAVGRGARLCPASNDLLIAKDWIAAGLSRRFIEDHLTDRMTRMKAAGKQSPGSLAFFDRSLRERGQGASAASQGDAPPPTSPEVELDGWRQRVAFWRGGGAWIASWGPKPGNGGCRRPKELLATHVAEVP